MTKILFAGAILALTASEVAAAEFLDDSASQFDPSLVTTMVRGASMQLRDPSSVQFRSLMPGFGNPRVICGQINGRNGFGGYAGFKPFFYEIKTNKVTIFQEEPQNPAFTELKLLVFKNVGCQRVVDQAL